MNRIILSLSILAACEIPATPSVDSSESSAGAESSSSDSGDPAESSDGVSATGGASSSDGSESTGEPVCEGAAGPHEGCADDCDCAAGLSCRYSYAGGYLAECTQGCEVDADCWGRSTCSGGWCVLPCNTDAGEPECPADMHCYPGVSADGTQVLDPAHPIPHCMPRAK